jgi:hypothetical protein
VLRGGAFNNNDRNVRCAYRNRNNPNNRNNNVGFRVVVRTFFFCIGNAWRFAALEFQAEVKNGGACSWPRADNFSARGQITTAPRPAPKGRGCGGAIFLG